MPSRNEIEIILKAADNASGVIDNVLSKVSGFGDGMIKAGGAITAATAPAMIAIGAAVKSAGEFDEAMTNVGAILGKNREEMRGLSADILAMGATSRAGPQQVAEAFYDIVGGVADASTHMDILSSAIATAEAGNADLAGTTSALIAVMNSYKFKADEAAYASDVLTQTVGMGVGTMNEFAGAFPQITGLANSMQIEFGDLGAMMAYLTTQGNSASQSATQLSATMTALLNPNEAMKDALLELGYANGQLAVEQLGLAGAITALANTQAVAQNGMARTMGSVEALRGVTALAGPEFAAFAQAFQQGIQGATDAAQQLQLESFNAQWDILRSQLSALGIEIGTLLLPHLITLVENVRPIVTEIMGWIQQNPQLTQQILGLTLAAGVAGPIMVGLGTAAKLVAAGVGLILSPAGLLIAAIGGILAVANSLYPGGIVQMFRDATTSARQLATIGILALQRAMQSARAIVEGFIGIIQAAIDKLHELMAAMGAAGVGAQTAQSAVSARVASGNAPTRAELDALAFNATAAQFGGGVVGDVIARLTYSNIADAAQGSNKLPGMADGGNVLSGRPYIVGERGPELFVPRGSGSIVPNESLGGVQIGQVVIHANSAAEGRAAADGFEARMMELRRATG